MVWPFTSSPVPEPEPVEIHPDSVDLRFTYRRRESDDEPPRKFQRLVVCCDGTWQSVDSMTKANEEDPDPSNVSRFMHSLRLSTREKEDPIVLQSGDTVYQRAVYVSGVGTNGWWDKYVGGAFGTGIESNIVKGYQWLCTHYREGDEIFVIGFSRGAYTARSLAGFIQDVGLLKFKDEEDFQKMFTEIFTAYRNPGPWNSDFAVRSKTRNDIFRKYMETKGYRFPLYFNVPIKGIGVFDTVGALGIPTRMNGLVEWAKRRLDWDVNRQYEFHNPGLGLGVKNAFHAIALDEQRYAFRPTLWYWPAMPDPIPDELFDSKNGEHLRIQALATSAGEPDSFMQCWFPGVHIDIGGGTNSGKFPAFSDLTLLWMMQRFNDGVYKELLEFQPNVVEEIIQAAWNRKPYVPKPKPGMFSKITSPITSLFSSPSPPSPPPAPATITAASTSAPTTTTPGLSAQLTKWVQAGISGTGSKMTALSGLVPRTPGIWTEFDHPAAEYISPDDPANASTQRAEYIHAVVRLRMENKIALPDSLKDWVYDSDMPGGAWVHKNKEGAVDIQIAEYVPGGAEKRLIAGSDEAAENINFRWWAPIGGVETPYPGEGASKKTV